MVMIMQMNCPYCGKPAVLGNRTMKYRRGDRTVSVEVQHWSCPESCAGEDGVRPFQFHDADLLSANDDAARSAWRAAFGEEMPPSERRERSARDAGDKVQAVDSSPRRLPRFPMRELADPSGTHRKVA